MLDHRLLDQAAEDVPDSIWRQGGIGADLLSRLQAEAAREHPESIEDGALLAVEQPVAPVQSGTQRLVALHGPAAGSDEEVEAVAQPLSDLAGRHRADPRRH